MRPPALNAQCLKVSVTARCAMRSPVLPRHSRTYPSATRRRNSCSIWLPFAISLTFIDHAAEGRSSSPPVTRFTRPSSLNFTFERFHGTLKRHTLSASSKSSNSLYVFTVSRPLTSLNVTVSVGDSRSFSVETMPPARSIGRTSAVASHPATRASCGSTTCKSRE